MNKEQENKEEDISKEVNDICKSLENYRKKHNYNCSIYVDICGFKGKDYDVVDDRIFAFGLKDCLIIMLEEQLKLLKNTKEEFIEY